MVWDGGSEPLVVPTRWALLGVTLGRAPVWPSSGGVGFTEKSVVSIRPPRKPTLPSTMLSLGPLLLAFNLFGASVMELVNLGTADDFAILSKTGVSTTGMTSVTGDVGTSPIAATAITGFSLILDSPTTFSASSFSDGECPSLSAGR